MWIYHEYPGGLTIWRQRFSEWMRCAKYGGTFHQNEPYPIFDGPEWLVNRDRQIPAVAAWNLGAWIKLPGSHPSLCIASDFPCVCWICLACYGLSLGIPRAAYSCSVNVVGWKTLENKTARKHKKVQDQHEICIFIDFHLIFSVNPGKFLLESML